MLKKLIKEFLLVVLIGIVISPAQWLTKLYFENYKYYGISVVWKDYDGTFLYVVLISISTSAAGIDSRAILIAQSLGSHGISEYSALQPSQHDFKAASRLMWSVICFSSHPIARTE